MYSPQIREDLVMRIYHAAKEASITMTGWVNKAVEQTLINNERRKKRSDRDVVKKRKSN